MSVLEQLGMKPLGKVSGKKALILYASGGGNTHKIAEVFQKVLLDYGFEVTMHRAVNTKTPVRIQGYDLYLVGSGVFGGIPEPNLLGAFGAGNYAMMVQTGLIGGGDRSPHWGRDLPLSKGILFGTYGGNRRGPSELLCFWGMLEMMMTEMDIACMGKFACAGLKAGGRQAEDAPRGGHWLSDEIAKEIGVFVGDNKIGELKAKYDAAPEGSEAMAMTERLRWLFHLQNHPDEIPEDIVDVKTVGLPRDWHNESVSRPNARDLVKAEIFLTEFIEDVFLPDECESILDTQYISIC